MFVAYHSYYLLMFAIYFVSDLFWRLKLYFPSPFCILIRDVAPRCGVPLILECYSSSRSCTFVPATIVTAMK